MRKIALSIGLFLLFASVTTPRVEAACSQGVKLPGGGASCPNETIACPANNPFNPSVKCCDTDDECPAGTMPDGVSQTYKICDAVPEGGQQSACRSCMEEGNATWTAIGCIEGFDNPEGFLSAMLRLGVGLAGGIAFLLILFGGLQIMTSAGNPEQLNAGRELVSAAITGLILIIFSIFLLGFIGGNIIGIPKFG